MTETLKENMDILLNHISNGDDDLKRDLQQYLMYRGRYGKEEAKKEYPQCARLKIEHGKAKFAWDMILNAVDKKRKENENINSSSD